MYDGIRNYFVECVLADYETYIDYKNLKQAGMNVDLRLSMHACSSMLNLADHIFEEMQTQLSLRGINSLRQYHEFLESKCTDFRVVRDAANAHKHRHLTKNSPCIKGAESIGELVIITEYKDKNGPYRIAEKEVHVTLLDGSVKKLHESLAGVRDMWWDEMNGFGITLPTPKPVYQKQLIPKREQPGENAALDIKVRRAVRLNLVIQLQKFNYKTMVAEIVDPATLKPV